MAVVQVPAAYAALCAAADLNNDGVVDVKDLALAQAQLGMQITVVV